MEQHHRYIPPAPIRRLDVKVKPFDPAGCLYDADTGFSFFRPDKERESGKKVQFTL